MLRRFLRWYFVRRITKAEDNLKRLEDEREEIFKNLMEKETYKRVVELMKKYFPEKLKDEAETERSKKLFDKPGANPNVQTSNLKNKRDASPTHNAGLRHRRTPALGGTQGNGNGNVAKQNSSQNPSEGQQLQMQGPPPPMHHPNGPLMRPILSQNRSTSDRIIDWVLGDGVENRYALICSSCCSHNGMALKEEFEYLGLSKFNV